MDRGDVAINVDFKTGMIEIGIRPPLGLESSRVKASISILDFLDHGASITLELNKMQRAMAAQFAQQTRVTA